MSPKLTGSQDLDVEVSGPNYHAYNCVWDLTPSYLGNVGPQYHQTYGHVFRINSYTISHTLNRHQNDIGDDLGLHITLPEVHLHL